MSESTKYEDNSITGQLKNFMHMGFSDIQCITESIENVIDSGANNVKLLFYYDNKTKKRYFVSAGDGKGMTIAKMKYAQMMNNFKESRKGKNGKFGYGYAVMRSVFSQNTGKIIWLSCHKNLTEEETQDPFRSGKFAQLVIDMDESMKKNFLHKTPTREILRCYEDFWNKFAINKYKTGTVVMVEMPKEKFNIVYSKINNTDPLQNTNLILSKEYAESLRNGKFTLEVDGKTIEDLPDPNPEISFIRIWHLYKLDEAIPDDSDVWGNGKKITDRTTKFMLFGVDEEGNTNFDDAYVCCKSNNRRMFKKVDNNNKHTNVNKKNHIATFKSTFICDIQNYFKSIRIFLQNYGLDIGSFVEKTNEWLIQQELRTIIITDQVYRNGKFIRIDLDPEKDSGNKDIICCYKDVINTIELIMDDDTEKNNMIDGLFSVNVNKGRIYRENMDPQIKFMLGCIKRTENKNYFYEISGLAKKKKDEKAAKKKQENTLIQKNAQTEEKQNTQTEEKQNVQAGKIQHSENKPTISLQINEIQKAHDDVNDDVNDHGSSDDNDGSSDDNDGSSDDNDGSSDDNDGSSDGNDSDDSNSDDNEEKQSVGINPIHHIPDHVIRAETSSSIGNPLNITIELLGSLKNKKLNAFEDALARLGDSSKNIKGLRRIYMELVKEKGKYTQPQLVLEKKRAFYEYYTYKEWICDIELMLNDSYSAIDDDSGVPVQGGTDISRIVIEVNTMYDNRMNQNTNEPTA